MMLLFSNAQYFSFQQIHINIFILSWKKNTLALIDVSVNLFGKCDIVCRKIDWKYEKYRKDVDVSVAKVILFRS